MNSEGALAEKWTRLISRYPWMEKEIDSIREVEAAKEVSIIVSAAASLLIPMGPAQPREESGEGRGRGHREEHYW